MRAVPGASAFFNQPLTSTVSFPDKQLQLFQGGAGVDAPFGKAPPVVKVLGNAADKKRSRRVNKDQITSFGAHCSVQNRPDNRRILFGIAASQMMQFCALKAVVRWLHLKATHLALSSFCYKGRPG